MEGEFSSYTRRLHRKLNLSDFFIFLPVNLKAMTNSSIQCTAATPSCVSVDYEGLKLKVLVMQKFGKRSYLFKPPVTIHHFPKQFILG